MPESVPQTLRVCLAGRRQGVPLQDEVQERADERPVMEQQLPRFMDVRCGQVLWSRCSATQAARLPLHTFMTPPSVSAPRASKALT